MLTSRDPASGILDTLVAMWIFWGLICPNAKDSYNTNKADRFQEILDEAYASDHDHASVHSHANFPFVSCVEAETDLQVAKITLPPSFQSTGPDHNYKLLLLHMHGQSFDWEKGKSKRRRFRSSRRT